MTNRSSPPMTWATTTFALLGAIAIGAGIITFVAADWSNLDALARFEIVLGAALAAYAAGLALRARGMQPFAEAAFTCGALACGGAIALGAQEFNAELALWQLYALWGAALIPLAVVLRSAPVATVALAAGAVSLPLHIFGEFGAPWLRADTFAHFALAAGGALLLTWRIGSLWYRELSLAFAALGVFLVVGTTAAGTSLGLALGGVAALALAAGAARSRALAIAASLVAFCAALPSTFWFLGGYLLLPDGPALDLYGAAVIVAVGVAVWYVRRVEIARFAPSAAALGVAIVLPHAGHVPHLAGVVAANALVLVPAAELIARGVAARERTAFMGGTAIFTVLGFLRFAEYDHDLTRKAIAFVAVGAAFVATAVLFERQGRSAGELSHAA